MCTVLRKSFYGINYSHIYLLANPFISLGTPEFFVNIFIYKFCYNFLLIDFASGRFLLVQNLLSVDMEKSYSDINYSENITDPSKFSAIQNISLSEICKENIDKKKKKFIKAKRNKEKINVMGLSCTKLTQQTENHEVRYTSSILFHKLCLLYV